jgi:hypothetical protein
MIINFNNREWDLLVTLQVNRKPATRYFNLCLLAIDTVKNKILVQATQGLTERAVKTGKDFEEAGVSLTTATEWLKLPVTIKWGTDRFWTSGSVPVILRKLMEYAPKDVHRHKLFREAAKPSSQKSWNVMLDTVQVRCLSYYQVMGRQDQVLAEIEQAKTNFKSKYSVKARKTSKKTKVSGKKAISTIAESGKSGEK